MVNTIPESRNKRGGSLLNILLFSPIGLPLLLIRLIFCSSCVVLNGLFGAYIPSFVIWLTKFVSQILLGQYVSIDNKRRLKKKTLLLPNEISHLDSCVFSLFYDFQPVQVANVPSYIHSMFNFTKLSLNEELRGKQMDTLFRRGHPVIAVPEEQDDKTTRCDWPFHDYNEIQPISVEVTRPIQIESFFQGGIADILWFFYSPLTVYDVTVMDVMKRSDDESPEQFSTRVRQEICLTGKTVERRKEQKTTVVDDKAAAEETMAVVKIRNVAKLKLAVTDEVIRQHYLRIGNVDETIVYFLEGGFAKDQEKALKKKAFSRNPFQRHQSFQERKDAFIAQARENYLKKQNLLSA